MKMTDAGIELVVCGSSARGMPTFAAWEAEVLEHTLDYVDYISIHTYFNNRDDDTLKYLSRPDETNDFIKAVVATCDHTAAKLKSPKQINLSFDEWNVWYHSTQQDRDIEPWISPRPINEDIYNMEDVLVVGGMLNTLLNNADRVKIACIAQTVNVIAPIMTVKGGDAWAQTTYYPFEQVSKYGRGTVLRQQVESQGYDLVNRKNVPWLSSSCVLNDDGCLTLFAINRHPDEPMDLRVILESFEPRNVLWFERMSHSDPKATNSAVNPLNVVPTRSDRAEIVDGTLVAHLEPLSWNVIRISD